MAVFALETNVQAPSAVWHPWWLVEVDGRPGKLLRANVIFRAVDPPAGDGRVRARSPDVWAGRLMF